MNRYLIVAATRQEIAPSLHALEIRDDARGPGPFHKGDANFDLLLTGVGPLASGARTANALNYTTYLGAFNFGIAGSFREDLGPGSVVDVVTEYVADIGAVIPEGQLDLYEMGLAKRDDPPFSEGALLYDPIFVPGIDELEAAKAVTVNLALRTPEAIQRVLTKYKPDIVSMEGAAFFFACLEAQVPFAEVRAVSNAAGEHDKKKWDIPKAISALNSKLRETLEYLRQL